MKNKNIINAWDKINASNATHQRILSNIKNKAHSTEKRKVPWKIFAPIATGLAAAVLVILILPSIINTNQQNLDFNIVVERPNPTIDENAPPNIIGDPRLETIPATPQPTLPHATENASELIPTIPIPALPPSTSDINVNIIQEQSDSSRIFIDGHFWHTLTQDELQAVLPGLGFQVHAVANYSGDGTLFNVSAYEILQNGDTAMFEEFFMRTTIDISPKGTPSGPLIYFDDGKQTSYIRGVPVIIGRSNVLGAAENVAMYQATFELSGIYYQIRLHDNLRGGNGQNRLVDIVDTIIQNGAANLSILDSPVIPELRDERLTLQEAKQDPNFGGFLPTNAPLYLSFDYARRVMNQTFNGIFAFWYKPISMSFESIRWQVGEATSHDFANVVSINQREKFDLSLYTIPFAESVPPELSQFVMNPVFLAHELTLEAVQSRALDSRGSIQMNFGVLFGNIVINVSATNIPPEEVWKMLYEIIE